MTDEDIIDCIMEVDRLLEEIEDALDNKRYKDARIKLKEARDEIEEFREEDDAEDSKETEMNIMKKLK